MYGLVLVLILTIMGGVIAFVGDRIGMKVGRKRLSMFGLRPRYTSVIITVITGIVVSATTLTVLTLVSNDVRTALFRMREIRETLSATALSLAETHEDLELKRREAEQLTWEVEAARERYSELEAEYDSLNLELSQAVKSRTQAEKDLARLKSELATTEATIARIEARYAAAKMDLDVAHEKLAHSQSEISGLQLEKARLDQQISELDETRTRLSEDVDRLKKEIRDLTETSVRLLEARQSSMLGQVIFSADQIVLGSVIDCSYPTELVREQVNEFLLKVNSIAIRKGARSEISPEDPFVLNFDESNVLAAFHKIGESSGKVILRAVSPVNSWYGEPLWVSLHVLPDQMIYFAGQVLASREIDGSASPDRIQEEVLALIQEVNSAAVMKGMASDDEGRIGTIVTISEFANVIMDIMRRGSKVTVEAVAESDIWRSHRSPGILLNIK